MTRNTLLRRAVVGTLAVTISIAISASLLAACGTGHDAMPGMGTATGSAADVSFAQNMIAQHGQTMQMASLAETRATDPELKALATQIKAAQSPQMATMTGWLQMWGQPTFPSGGHAGMAMPGMMSDADMSALGSASGVDFDRMFARMMIAHHNGAIQMAKEEQAKGSSPEAKSLAAAVEKDQSAEVTRLQSILDRL